MIMEAEGCSHVDCGQWRMLIVYVPSITRLHLMFGHSSFRDNLVKASMNYVDHCGEDSRDKLLLLIQFNTCNVILIPSISNGIEGSVSYGVWIILTSH